MFLKKRKSLMIEYTLEFITLGLYSGAGSFEVKKLGKKAKREYLNTPNA